MLKWLRNLFRHQKVVECEGCNVVLACNFHKPVGQKEIRFLRCPDCHHINIMGHDLTGDEELYIVAKAISIRNIVKIKEEQKGSLLSDTECDAIVHHVLSGEEWKVWEIE